MASFDLETFAKVTGNTGTGVFEALGMSYGMPSCLLNFGRDVLQLLPSNVLNSMKGQAAAGKKSADEFTSQVFKKLSLDTGIIEFDTEEGRIRFKSISSQQGGDSDEGSFLNDLGGFAGAVSYAANFGSQLYQNYQDIDNQINAIDNCINKFNDLRKFQKGNSASTAAASIPPGQLEESLNAKYAADIASLQDSTSFSASASDLLNNIGLVLEERRLDPSKEPLFLDTAVLDQFLSGTSYARVTAEDPEVGEEDEGVFRLIFGPPQSVDGQYILTSDGLYYDSTGDGISEAFLAISGSVALGDRWKYDYDPNLGGKGDSISIKSLREYTDNIFDPERIDDSQALQTYYDEDHFLSVLEQQRNKHIYDLSGDLQSIISSYGEDSSVTHNQRSIIAAAIANHNDKINRRKKQIEVSIKVPQLYGNSTSPPFAPGEVPINNFAYLEDYNLSVDVEKQRRLVFEDAELEGVVLPVQTVIVQTAAKPRSLAVDHLTVPTVGKGGIIYTPSGGTGSGTLLSLVDEIVDEDLFAIYNFLEPKVVTPSSNEFTITNCATSDRYNNAKLVAPNRTNVFFSGLSIPYLAGITKNNTTGDTAAASSLGSFIRLPDTPEFRDLTYKQKGFTFETWAHIPNITDGDLGWFSGTTSSLTKVMLGCENTGNYAGASALDYAGANRDLDKLPNDRGENFHRGLLCGFTRDRRITQESTGYSNENYNNDPVSSLSFFIAPTIARDSSSVSFINNDTDGCYDENTYFKMKVDLSSFATLANVSSQFVMLDVTVDPNQDKISMYADGALLATSSLQAVFGTEEKVPINLPNFKKDNSFEYGPSSVDGPITLKQGPKLNPYYTPWIVGGGYTDGMYNYNNFMGGDRGGVISGLHGHLGSVKFYSKPLSTQEVSQNYNAQKGYFKNIK